jgi:hypothetical protein
MIVLVTDFGLLGPYIGQMQAVIAGLAPGVPVLNLFADAPTHNPKATAYLLAAYHCAFPAHTVFVCVVDPGVGSWKDRPVVVTVDGRTFVGPDNGIFDIVARRGRCVESWPILWRPDRISRSFHGRDLYAPVAARIAIGQYEFGVAEAYRAPGERDWPDDLREIVYIDHFGNAMTGLRGAMLSNRAIINVRGSSLSHADTFAAVPVGQAFWYENSNGLAEIAVNQGRADERLGLRIGEAFRID